MSSGFFRPLGSGCLSILYPNDLLSCESSDVDNIAGVLMQERSDDEPSHNFAMQFVEIDPVTGDPLTMPAELSNSSNNHSNNNEPASQGTRPGIDTLAFNENGKPFYEPHLTKNLNSCDLALLEYNGGRVPTRTLEEDHGFFADREDRVTFDRADFVDRRRQIGPKSF